MIEPLRFSFEVDCPPEHAFVTWTEKTTSWWPLSHTVTGEPGLTVVFEGRPGGRMFERTAAGVEVNWGQITLWDPPRRLRYVWYLRADRVDATEVEITFRARGERTRVEIEHRGWERLGARGPDRREANQAGWGGLLPHFVEASSADRLRAE